MSTTWEPHQDAKRLHLIHDAERRKRSNLNNSQPAELVPMLISLGAALALAAALWYAIDWVGKQAWMLLR